MSEKKTIVLDKKILIRNLLSIVLGIITVFGIHHLGEIKMDERLSTDAYYTLESIFGVSHTEGRSDLDWSNEEETEIHRWKDTWRTANTPSYKEKITYFYIPITFKSWYIVLGFSIAYYGIWTFFTSYNVKVE